jgi:hypothetical protein
MTDSSNPRFKIRSDYLAAIAVAVLPILYFLPAIFRGIVLCPDDGLIQNVPFRVVAATMIGSGNLPLWNPYIFSGMPLLAAAQLGVLFPLNWFYLVFPPAIATNLMVVSSYIVAGLGAYLYARRIGATISGALLTGIVWQFSGALVGQIAHINVVHTAALLPWTLWALEAYAQEGSFKRATWLTVLIAIQVFAGHQQTFVYSLILINAYAIVMATANTPLRKRYLFSLGLIAMGVLLSAVQIVPTLELLRNSLRSATTYDFFTSFSMPKRFVLTFVAPYLMGGGDGRLFRAPYLGPPYYQEMVGYVGILTIMLGVIAVLLKADLRTLFWSVVALVCLLLAFGAYAPLQVNRLVYYIPVINLFRVPARHLMEVDFALAVLAGRGLSVLASTRGKRKIVTLLAATSGAVFISTFIVVTLLRPTEFHLGRVAPVTMTRAPELFLPVLISVVSGFALWFYAYARRGSLTILFAVLIIDLFLWGQFSGWFTASPRRDSEYWRTPDAVARLRELSATDQTSYRILTLPHSFDPAVVPVPPSVSHSPVWDLWTQPDVYMMHNVQNAAGYEGFGLSRYSELAGRMKVWGELTEPDTTLRTGSREIDLLNVRYLLAMREQPIDSTLRKASAPSFPSASVEYGGFRFSAEDLALPNLNQNNRITFTFPGVECDRIALITNLSWSEDIPEGTTVARLRLFTDQGRVSEFELKAGLDTAEWAYDRRDIRARIKHKRAPVAMSYLVNDADGKYEAHTYVTSFVLPEIMPIKGGEIVLEPNVNAPDLLLSVFRISLSNSAENATYPLPRDWLNFEVGKEEVSQSTPAQRWKRVAQTRSVDFYENRNVLPRAWLTGEVHVMKEAEMLEVIRKGKFADGSRWDPKRTALIESPISEKIQVSDGAKVEITHYAPNEIELTANSSTSSLLVLSENHYPGWHAYVDGRAVETLRVDYNLRGVVLSAGTHNVEFLYRPKSVLIGFLITLTTALGLALWPSIRKRI